MRTEASMSIDAIKQSELTQGERHVLTEDVERWKRIGEGGHLDGWLIYHRGFEIRRKLAMRLADVDRPEGKGYALAFNQLMRADGLDTMDMQSVSAVLWLGDEPERMRALRDIRDGMTPGERSRLNSPISARQRVTKALAARETSTEARLKQQVAELTRKNAELEQQLAAAKNLPQPSRRSGRPRQDEPRESKRR